MTQEEKRKVANLLIENEWYNKTLSFIAKAYNIDANTITAFINGNKPTINEESLNEYIKKVEELLGNEEIQNEEKK